MLDLREFERIHRIPENALSYPQPVQPVDHKVSHSMGHKLGIVTVSLVKLVREPDYLHRYAT